ncbi:hypothetical protein [Streptomyces sp. NPDC001678]|uniref:hypothetical protein n=1 Tax=Streptomyces sp. NPDC001678 TaxID=3364599 RepID=UPI0036867782
MPKHKDRSGGQGHARPPLRREHSQGAAPPLQDAARAAASGSATPQMLTALQHGIGNAAVARMASGEQGKPKARQESPQARANKEFATKVQQKLRERGWVVEGSPATWGRMTAHKVSLPAGADTAGLKSGAAAYKAAPGNVVAPHSYRSEPEKQALRWIASITMKHLNAMRKPPVEVQAALHAGALYIAANTKDANEALKGLADGRTGKEFLDRLIKDNPADQAQLALYTGRVDRHTEKARTRLVGPPTSEYAPVFEALGKPVVVAAAGTDGRHAERRIAELAGETPQYIAGTKRPCVSCYMKLFSGTPDRPGPFWLSGAANQGVEEHESKDVDRLVALIDEEIGNTYATLKWQCVDKCDGEAEAGPGPSKKRRTTPLGSTVDYGSDSDSDTEGTVRTFRA